MLQDLTQDPGVRRGLVQLGHLQAHRGGEGGRHLIKVTDWIAHTEGQGTRSSAEQGHRLKQCSYSATAVPGAQDLAQEAGCAGQYMGSTNTLDGTAAGAAPVPYPQSSSSADVQRWCLSQHPV
jgi:hypothetical protein